MAQKRQLITLLTDFGTADYFVAAMKGAAYSVYPDLEFVDITHEIPSFDIFGAAYTLRCCYDAFPRFTTHLVVVDPGIGSARRPIFVMTDNYNFIGPDNGVFSYIYQLEQVNRVLHLTADLYYRKPVSATFHGRDIFAPVAAHLARMLQEGSVDLSVFGPPARELQCFDFPTPVEERGGGYRGEVLHVDHFGNAVTNLPERWVAHAGGAAVVEAGGKSMPVVRTYSDVDVGELCAVVGSAGWLEVACRDDSAASRLGLAPGQPVVLKAAPRAS